MNQQEFQRHRNELISQYHIAVQPAWKKYVAKLVKAHSYWPRWMAHKEFGEAIKPHLEHLFTQIAGLKA